MYDIGLSPPFNSTLSVNDLFWINFYKVDLENQAKLKCVWLNA